MLPGYIIALITVPISILALAAIGVLAWAIRELRKTGESAFLHLQSRSVYELAEAQRMQAVNSVAVKHLQDEIARRDDRVASDPASPAFIGRGKLTDINGNSYAPSELEPL